MTRSMNRASVALVFTLLVLPAVAQDAQPARPEDAALDVEVRTFAIEEAVASVMAEACAPEGIVALGDVRIRATRMVDDKVRAGHTAEAVIEALRRQQIAMGAADATIEELQRNGIRRGDRDGLCRWAATEIASGSALGQRLGYK